MTALANRSSVAIIRSDPSKEILSDPGPNERLEG